MAAGYSVTEGAALLGVSAATLSRRLPAGRASQGRRATLALEELVAVAPAVGADPEEVRRRAAAAADVDPALPEEIRRWAKRAREEGAHFALDAYNARIPSDLLERTPEDSDPALEVREPWTPTLRTRPYSDLTALLTEHE